MTERCPVHPKLRRILDESGQPWSWRPRSRHWQLLIGGTVVLTSPYNHQDCGRQWQNAVACVRRAIRTLANSSGERT